MPIDLPTDLRTVQSAQEWESALLADGRWVLDSEPIVRPEYGGGVRFAEYRAEMAGRPVVARIKTFVSDQYGTRPHGAVSITLKVRDGGHYSPTLVYLSTPAEFDHASIEAEAVKHMASLTAEEKLPDHGDFPESVDQAFVPADPTQEIIHQYAEKWHESPAKLN